jgi:hypothetical protein
MQGCADKAEILGRKVLLALKILEAREKPELIFPDPYDKGEARRVLEVLSRSSILTLALGCYEHSLEGIDSILIAGRSAQVRQNPDFFFRPRKSRLTLPR